MKKIEILDKTNWRDHFSNGDLKAHYSRGEFEITLIDYPIAIIEEHYFSTFLEFEHKDLFEELSHFCPDENESIIDSSVFDTFDFNKEYYMELIMELYLSE